MEKFPKLALVYLSYHSEPYLDRFISSVQKTSYPFEQLELIIVDNFHPEFGSSEKILREKVEMLSEKNFPHVTILPQEKNLGFSGGVNVGIRKALQLSCKYVYLHNQDGFTDVKAFEKLVEVMENDQTIGAAQSLMLLYPEVELINNSGNNFHYLGFGYVKDFRKKSDYSSPQPPPAGEEELVASSTSAGGSRGRYVQDIGYASGAAVLLRTDLLQKYGLWDEDYFLYHEDLEYSLRLKILSYRIVTVRNSIFYHRYEFSRNKNKYYFTERNRWGFLLTYYKLPTLILLFPINLVIELGMICFAIVQGWGKEKFQAYGYWLKPRHWKLWLKKRKNVQNLRLLKDKIVLQRAVVEIHFSEAGLDNPVLKYIANPLMKIYFIFLKRVLFW